MEASILKSVKTMLGLAQNDSGFDLEVMTHINASFFVLQQIGVTPGVFQIESDLAEWPDVGITNDPTGLIRSYIFLKVKSLWDPPQTSFLINLTKDQLAEFETRLHIYAEVGLNG